jgi:hypothetical protein
MRMSVTFAVAILSAIVLITAWSISMLPRGRDVAAIMQTPGSEQSLPKWIVPVRK